MPLNVTVTFSASADAPSDLKVRRYELREAISELFELTVEVLSSDPQIDEHAVVGQAVVVDFGDEPFLKEIHGIVRQMEQRTAVPSGDSLYVWTVVPPLWLTTRRRDHRIFQNASVPEIVAAVLTDATYGGRIAAPAQLLGAHEPREYVVQYAETDWEFLARLLADEGIASFFDHAGGSVWTLVDDTSASAPSLTGSIPFSDPTNLNPVVAGGSESPHVQTAVIRSGVETSAVTLRDYDFEKPEFILEAKKASDAGAFTNESPLEAYTFEVGKFTTQAPGDARAARVLDADRTARRRLLCTSSFALPPGTRMPLVDHPRADLAGDFLVVSARTVMEADSRGTHELTLMDLTNRFRPPMPSKPRIFGTQTALVVGAEGEEIDVDKHGRVIVALRWDRRDKRAGEITRRVRVAQGWAGADRGLMTLPRVKDEVIVAYLDGDPDQPIIVGRVHNGLSTCPLSLPAQKTCSIWKSRSTPGGNGFNAILMDDAAGDELLAFKAQRDFRSDTGRNAVRTVGNDDTETIDGDQTITIKGNQRVSVSGTKRTGIGGSHFVDGQDMTLNAKNIVVDADDIDVGAGHMKLHSDGTIEIVATRILLQAGGSTIDVTAGEIVITSPMIKLNP
jgi:type VI secretion system secreted protein VgrG